MMTLVDLRTGWASAQRFSVAANRRKAMYNMSMADRGDFLNKATMVWRDPQALKLAADSVRPERRQLAASLSVMRMVDWHVAQHLVMPLSVIRALARVLEVPDHLERLEGMAWAAVAERRGDTVPMIAMAAGVSEATIFNWRKRPDYQRLLSQGPFPWPVPEDLSAALDAIRDTAEECHKASTERGDKYPPRFHRERLINVAVWYSSRGQHLPFRLWWPIACALGLANWNGLKRETMLALRGMPNPEAYIAAAKVDGTEKLSASALAARFGIDKATAIRWRRTESYKWNMRAPAIYERWNSAKGTKPRVRRKIVLQAMTSTGRLPFNCRVIL